MKKNNILPVIILFTFIVLVPISRCRLFFDAFLIKLWIVQFGTSILFIYFCRRVLFRQGKIFYNVTIDSFLLAYLLINVLSWILIPSPHRYPALLTLNSLFVYVLLCFIVSQYIKEDKFYSIAALIWIITTIVICIYSIVWQYMKKQMVTGTLGNENFFSSYLGISILVSLGYFLGFTKTNKKMLLPGAIILALFCITLYFTKSRGSWLGLFWAITSFIIIGWCPKGKRLLIIILFLFLIIALVCTPWGIRFVYDQLHEDPRGIDVRPAIWEGTLYMIAEKPWLGWGKGAYFIFYPRFRIKEYWLTKQPTDLTIHAHNEFLQIWSETGLVGLGIFLCFIFTVLKFGIKTVDERKWPQKYLLLGIICGIIGLLTQNLVCNNLQMPSSAVFLWFMLGLVISCIPSRVLKINPAPSSGVRALLDPAGRTYSPLHPRKKLWVFRRRCGVNLHSIFRYGFFLALTLFMVIIIWQTGVRSAVSQYIFRQGLQYREEEKWGLAIEEYEKAINWYPWDVEMRYRTAYAYTMDKQYDMAIEKYKDVTRLAPLYGSVHKNMGIVYMKKGDNRSAIMSFQQQLYINEYDFISQVNLRNAMENYANR